MHILKFIFLLTSTLTLGQRNDTTVKTIFNIYDFSDSRFDIDSNGFHGTTKADTTYYTDGKIASIGHYAVAKNSRMSGNKFGLWTKYYYNGQIKSQGSYAMHSLLSYLSPTKGLRLESSYKVGTWTYYYESGQIKTTWKYRIVTSKASTGIPNQCNKKSTMTDDWLFFNPDGSKAIDKRKLIAEIEYNPDYD